MKYSFSKLKVYSVVEFG